MNSIVDFGEKISFDGLKNSSSKIFAVAALALTLGCSQPDQSSSKKIDKENYAVFDDSLFLLKKDTANAYMFSSNYDKTLIGLFELYDQLVQSQDFPQKKIYLRTVCSDIGFTYLNMNQFENSIKWNQSAYMIAIILNDAEKQIKNLNDLGISYANTNNLDNGFMSFKKALDLIESEKKIDIISKSPYTVYLVYINLSNYYVSKKEYNLAKPYFIKAKEIFETHRNQIPKDKEVIFLSCEADFLIADGKYQETIQIYQKALTIAKNINHLEYQKWLLHAIEGIHKDQFGDYKKAYQYATEANAVESELMNIDKAKSIIDVETNYKVKYETQAIKDDNEKKDLVIEKNEESKQKFIIGLTLTGILLLFAGGSYLSIKKQKKLVEQKNEELKDKNNIIEQKSEELRASKEIVEKQNCKLIETNIELAQKNKTIRDQQNYAEKIQNLILYNKLTLPQVFPKSFLLNQPRDGVGGDFYFVHEDNNKKVLVLSDCTGHGIPGALLTITGHFFLKNAIEKAKSPSDLLCILDKDFHNLHYPDLSRAMFRLSSISSQLNDIVHIDSSIKEIATIFDRTIKVVDNIEDPFKFIFENLPLFETILETLKKKSISSEFIGPIVGNLKYLLLSLEKYGKQYPVKKLDDASLELVSALLKSIDSFDVPKEYLQAVIGNLNILLERKEKTNNGHDISVGGDSMDTAVVYIENKNNILHYSGVHTPLYIVRNGELIELKYSSSSIGDKKTASFSGYKEELFQLLPKDRIYVSSDGFADQFSVEDGKKLGKKNFRNLILDCQNIPIEQQQTYFKEFYNKRTISSNGEIASQVDDIMVIGVEI